jgi:thiol-disulfide isomerase/thioredoxin
VAALLAAAAVGITGCAGGAIAASTPASNGQSFVGGQSGTTVFGAGKGPAVPRVAGTTLTGARLSLSQDAGHVVVMNFWGSWCSPCRAEAPTLGTLARQFRSRGVRFVGVDIRDSPANARAFLGDFNIGYPSLNDPGDEIALAFRGAVTPAGIPTTLVIGRDGRIAARVIGQVSYPGLRGLISRALAQPR